MPTVLNRIFFFLILNDTNILEINKLQLRTKKRYVKEKNWREKEIMIFYLIHLNKKKNSFMI